jgi:hypothetical protein
LTICAVGGWVGTTFLAVPFGARGFLVLGDLAGLAAAGAATAASDMVEMC